MSSSIAEPAARELRDWRTLLWLSAEVVSLVGDTVFFLVLSWTAVELAGPGGIGIVLASAAVPRALLMLLGGAVVDRFGARRVAMFTDLVRGIVVTLAAIAAAVSTTLPMLIALGVVFGIFDALFYPASGALAPLIVAEHDLLRVQGLRGLGTRAALIVGAAAGGLIIEFANLSAALAFDAGTFGVSLIALGLVRASAQPAAGEVAQSLVKQIQAGLGYARDNEVLRKLLLLVALFEFAFNGVANVGFPTLASAAGGGSSSFGMMVAALGAGAAVASLLVTVIRGSLRPYLGVSGAAILGGVVAAFMPHVHSRLAVVALAFGLGVSGGCVGAVAIPIVQLEVEASHLGRVMSLFSVATVGMAPFSLAVASFVIRQTTPSWAFAGACALAAAGGAICLCSRSIRELRLPDRGGREPAL